MLNLKEILPYYPEKLHKFKQFIFKEYLQYLILQIIFESKYSEKLSFLGGTCLRIIFENKRFSEDLDFDNFGLTEEEFLYLSKIVKEKLEKIGFEVEIKTVFKGAFRCSIKIPKILKDLGFSNLESEKILIQIDTAPHGFEYQVETKILNKFGLVFPVRFTPLDIIASQKIWAIFNRKRLKGRDFFDLVFILGKTDFNFEYLQEKLGVKTKKELKEKFEKFLENIDFDYLIKDVEVFLFDENGKNNIKYFKEIVLEKI